MSTRLRTTIERRACYARVRLFDGERCVLITSLDRDVTAGDPAIARLKRQVRHEPTPKGEARC